MAYCAYCGSHVPQVSYAPCPSCGNPTNGAPPRPKQPGGGTSAVAIIIGVIAAAFVGIAIIGILAAIAIPNLLTATQRSRQKRTMADIRTIATTVEAYRQDNGSLPAANNLQELGPLVAKYGQSMPTVDGWGTELHYATSADSYTIASAGANKQFEEVTRGATHHFDCDIVFTNGEFVQYPEGVLAGGGN